MIFQKLYKNISCALSRILSICHITTIRRQLKSLINILRSNLPYLLIWVHWRLRTFLNLFNAGRWDQFLLFFLPSTTFCALSTSLVPCRGLDRKEALCWCWSPRNKRNPTSRCKMNKGDTFINYILIVCVIFLLMNNFQAI